MVMTAKKQQIKKLLDKGLSGNAITKKLHLRKQDVLAEIRKLKGTSIQQSKVTNLKGQTGSAKLSKPSKAFVEVLYKEGYPETFIAKLVNAKHPDTSRYEIKKYLKQYKQLDANAVTSHKANMKFYKSTGKWKQHLDAKYYRETTIRYYKDTDEQFKEGSPKLEYEVGVEDEIL